MMTLFALSLPGLVIVIIALGVLQLTRAKISGRRRPGSATAGIDFLDVVLKPGSEHRVLEQQSIKIKRNEDERDAPPFSEGRIDGKSFKWKAPPKA
jgi:hypothetical protein